MKKNLITKCWIVLLISIIFSTMIFGNSVYATNFEQEETTENIILKHDVATKEVTEINIEELTNGLVTRNSTVEDIYNSLSAYRPSVAPIVRKMELNPRSSGISLLANTSVERITDTSNFPNIITCRLHSISVDGKENRYGTGILVGHNILLTAAHCVMDVKSNGELLNNGIVFPGYNDYAGAIYYGDSSNWHTIYSSPNWNNGDGTFNEAYDWAICVLNKNLGDLVGYNGMRSYGSNSALNGLAVNCLGYPGETNYGFTADAGDQYRAWGNITNVGNLYFKFNGTTYSGFSGGPAMDQSDDIVIGIVQGKDGNNKPYCVRVTSEMVNLVNTLRNQ